MNSANYCRHRYNLHHKQHDKAGGEYDERIDAAVLAQEERGPAEQSEHITREKCEQSHAYFEGDIRGD